MDNRLNLVAFVAATCIALPALALEDAVKEALDVGCAKLAKREAKVPCAGVANLVQYKLARVGVPGTDEAHAYCVKVCERTRAR